MRGKEKREKGMDEGRRRKGVIGKTERGGAGRLKGVRAKREDMKEEDGRG